MNGLAAPNCEICSAPTDQILTKSIGSRSISSDSEIKDTDFSCLFYCDRCAYYMTRTRFAAGDLYASNYSLLSSDFFEDHRLFGAVEPNERNAYQASLIAKFFPEQQVSSTLEIGAGKGLTSYHLSRRMSNAQISVYDPGHAIYERNWRKYIKDVGVYQSLAGVEARFDLIFSFFVLEHIPDPKKFFSDGLNVLADGGVFIGCVPDLNMNIGDALVSDHLRHLSLSSLDGLVAASLPIDESYTVKCFREPGLRAVFFAISKDSGLKSLQHGNFDTSIQTPVRLNDVRSAWIHTRKMDIIRSFSGRKLTLWGCNFYARLLDLSLGYPVHRIVDSNSHFHGNEFACVSGSRLRIDPPESLRDFDASSEVLVPCMSRQAAESLVPSLSPALMASLQLIF